MAIIKMHIVRYVTNKSDPKLRNFYLNGSKIEYMIRPDGALFHSRRPEANEDFVKSLNVGRRKRATNSGLFSFNFALNEVNYVNPQDIIKKMKCLDPKQLIWDGRISLSGKNSDYFRFGNQTDFMDLVQRYMPSFLKTEGIDPKNINLLGSVHADTKNPHLHFVMFEKKPIIFNTKTKELEFRKKGKLQLGNIQNFAEESSKFVVDRFKEETIYKLKKDFWTNKNELKAHFREHRFEEITQLVQPVIEEAKTMKTRVYAKLSPESQKAIQQYFYSELPKLDPDIKQAYLKHKQFLLKHPENKHFINENKNLEIWIGNKILNELIFIDNQLEWEKNHPLTTKIVPKSLSYFIKNSPKRNIGYLLDQIKWSNHLDKYDYQRKYKYLRQYQELQKQSPAKKYQNFLK